jgi:hypothetical protein
MNALASQAAALRRFNRFYTGAIGVLTDRYLGLSRPLGEARVLFEMARTAPPSGTCATCSTWTRATSAVS